MIKSEKVSCEWMCSVVIEKRTENLVDNFQIIFFTSIFKIRQSRIKLYSRRVTIKKIFKRRQWQLPCMVNSLNFRLWQSTQSAQQPRERHTSMCFVTLPVHVPIMNKMNDKFGQILPENRLQYDFNIVDIKQCTMVLS